MKHGKNYRASQELIDRSRLYDTAEAVQLALQTAKAKFDETIELSIRLGVDPVSYTHLDVYKRQAGRPAAREGEGARGLQRRAGTGLSLIHI